MHNHQCLSQLWKSHYCAQTQGKTATSSPRTSSNISLKYSCPGTILYLHFRLTMNPNRAVPSSWGTQICEPDLKKSHLLPYTCDTVRVGGIQNRSLGLFPDLICSASPLAKGLFFYASLSVSIMRKVQPCELNVACRMTTEEHPVPMVTQPTGCCVIPACPPWIACGEEPKPGDHCAQLQSLDRVRSSSPHLPFPKPLLCAKCQHHHLGLTPLPLAAAGRYHRMPWLVNTHPLSAHLVSASALSLSERRVAPH